MWGRVDHTQTPALLLFSVWVSFSSAVTRCYVPYPLKKKKNQIKPLVPQMLGSPVLPNSALLGPRLSPSLSLPLPNTGSGSGKMTSGPRDGFPRSRDVYRLDYPLCLFKSIEPAARSLPHSLVARMALLTHKPYQGKWGHSARLDQSGSTSRPGETAAFRVK